MPERPDRDPAGRLDRRRELDPETRRIAFAAGRIGEHAEQELKLLERAVQEPDDVTARELEIQADMAYRDFVAMIQEHGLER